MVVTEEVKTDVAAAFAQSPKKSSSSSLHELTKILVPRLLAVVPLVWAFNILYVSWPIVAYHQLCFPLFIPVRWYFQPS